MAQSSTSTGMFYIAYDTMSYCLLDMIKYIIKVLTGVGYTVYYPCLNPKYISMHDCVWILADIVFNKEIN